MCPQNPGKASATDERAETVQRSEAPLVGINQTFPMSPKIRVLLLPGIGGIPAFHQDILSSLSNDPLLDVIAFPHGDCSLPPFKNFSSHIDHWAEKIKLIMDQSVPVALVGISFGAAIIQSLPTSLLTKASRICLVSPVCLPIFAKLILLRLRHFPACPFSIIPGLCIKWWSNMNTSDRVRLDEIREKYYDSQLRTFKRLWFRLLGLCQAKDIDELCMSTPLVPKLVICFQSEYLRKFVEPRLTSIKYLSPKILEYQVLPGTHSSSVNPSPILAQSLRCFLMRRNHE